MIIGIGSNANIIKDFNFLYAQINKHTTLAPTSKMQSICNKDKFSHKLFSSLV